MEKKIDLSLKLYKARNNAKLTIEDAAFKIGVSDRMIRYYESGKKKPSLVTLVKICEVYGVEISSFI